MYVTPSAPQSIGGVIDDAIRLYRHSIARCWMIGFIPALASAALQATLSFHYPGYGTLTRAGIAEAAMAGRAMPAIGLVSILLAILGAAFAGGIVAKQAAITRGDESFTLGRSFAAVLRRLPALLLCFLLFYLVLFGVAIVFAIVIGIGIFAFKHHPLGRPMMGAIMIAGIGIPCFILIGRLQLFLVAIFVDGKGPLAALRTSWRLTKGHWWRASAILGVAIIMIMVISISFTALIQLAAYVTHVSLIDRLVVTPLISLVSATLLYPMGSAVGVAMYNDFKLRREGSDLAARVGALNSA